MIFAE